MRAKGVQKLRSLETWRTGQFSVKRRAKRVARHWKMTRGMCSELVFFCSVVVVGG